MESLSSFSCTRDDDDDDDKNDDDEGFGDGRCDRGVVHDGWCVAGFGARKAARGVFFRPGVERREFDP